MKKEPQLRNNLSLLLKNLSINFGTATDKELVDKSPAILDCHFRVKSLEDEEIINGSLQKRTTHYLFYNDVLIDVIIPRAIKDFSKVQINYIESHFETELIISALKMFEFSSFAGDLHYQKSSKIHRQIHKFRNKEVANQDMRRRNFYLTIKSGRPKGSKKREEKYKRSELLLKLSAFIKSYYETQGEEPTQEVAAITLGLEYAKKLRRLLNRYGDDRDWRTIVRDILARSK